MFLDSMPSLLQAEQLCSFSSPSLDGISRFLPIVAFVAGTEHSAGRRRSIIWLLQVPCPVNEAVTGGRRSTLTALLAPAVLFPGIPQTLTSCSAPGSTSTICHMCVWFGPIFRPMQVFITCDLILLDSAPVCHLEFSSCKKKKPIKAIFLKEFV